MFNWILNTLQPSKSKSLGQYNTKLRHVSKKAVVSMGLLTDQISLKIVFKIFLVDFGRDFSCSKSMFLPKLQLRFTKNVK